MACNDKNKFAPGGVCDTAPCRDCKNATKSCAWSECPRFKNWFKDVWARLPKPETQPTERNDKGALICSKCKTEVVLRLDGQPGSLEFKPEPYCAHCGARLIEEDKK